MYWFMANNPLALIPWILAFSITWLGGSLIATYSFQLSKEERLVAGLGIGLTGYLFLTNIFGQVLQPGLAFSLPAGGLLLFGIYSTVRAAPTTMRKISQIWTDLGCKERGTWIWLIASMSLFLLFLLISRGLAIFDEPKNLSLTSLIGRGDFPPHYYMNADYYFRYHYGFQILSASLVRIGGMFPWSAFDSAKSIVFAAALVTAGVIGKRVTGRWEAAIAFACLMALGSGTRYLLLFLPQEWLAGFDMHIRLVGTSATVQEPFSQALRQGWSIQGGPPVPYPFAFINGILPPLVISHNGTTAFSTLILLLLILLAPNQSGGGSAVIVTILLAVWALTWESSYVLFALGGALAGGLLVWRERIPLKNWRKSKMFANLGLPILASLPLSLVQGGVLTETARKIFLQSAESGIGVEGSVSGLGFSLRWPPAILSSHLAPLNLTQPQDLLVGLFELGPVFLFAPVVSLWIFRRRKRNLPGQIVLELLAFSAWVGFLLPIFFAYQADRDITRFSGYGLGVWMLLLAWMLWEKAARQSLWLRITGTTSLALAMVSGGMILASNLSAVPHPVLGFSLSGMDARICRDYWGKLEDSLIFDPGLWRGAMLTGLKTRAAVGNNPTSEWLALIKHPHPEQLLDQGYRYVYIDDEWWETLSAAEKNGLAAPCVARLAEYWDAEHEHFRRLIDLKKCEPSEGNP